MTERAGRPKFWSSIFRKQPIEAGVADPIEEDIARVRERYNRESANLNSSVNALLDDLARKHRARYPRGTPNV